MERKWIVSIAWFPKALTTKRVKRMLGSDPRYHFLKKFSLLIKTLWHTVITGGDNMMNILTKVVSV